MNPTIADLVLSVEIFMFAVTMSFAFAYALREIERLRERVYYVEEEVDTGDTK